MRNFLVLLAVSLFSLGACGSSEDGDEADANISNPDGAVTIDAAATPDSSPGAIDASTPDAAPPDATQAAGHTVNNSGVWHHPGYQDPLTNCVSCHGADLTGGDGPSCYTCHNNDDHDINRGGHMHKSGSPSTCNTCHGPNNTGGLGPACTECH